MKKLSVVLLNFNGKHHLEAFLPSVVQYSTPHEVVLVDNGSNDGSIEFVKETYPSISLITFSENHGFCGGYNKAIPLINSEYVVLLNTDVEVTKNWIEPVLAHLESDVQIKAAQPKVLDFKAKDKFEYAGASGGFIDSLGYPFCRGRIFQTLEKDIGQYDNTSDIFWASGSCFFVHRETYISLGGLDEDFFAHMEEIDLCWRIWNSNGRIVVSPQSKVYHVGGGTLDKTKPRKTYLNFRNGLSLLLKNEDSYVLLWKFPLRIALDWVALVKFSLESGPKHGLAIFRAHCYILFNLGSTLKKRGVHQKNPHIPRFRGWVILSYFISGRKTFKELKRDS